MESVPVTVAAAQEGDAGRSVSPFLVIGDTRPFWVAEK